ncbi:MAG TPA: SAP domain-containing protein [Gammaproteobacteria bacterium]|nr:SAP domain-containing protein [Gammaproteobacteria bacterium]
MLMQQIRTIAKQHGIKAGKTKKADLIRKIQQVEGNYACFGTASNGECDQLACLWREDCLGASKKLLRQ